MLKPLRSMTLEELIVELDDVEMAGFVWTKGGCYKTTSGEIVGKPYSDEHRPNSVSVNIRNPAGGATPYFNITKGKTKNLPFPENADYRTMTIRKVDEKIPVKVFREEKQYINAMWGIFRSEGYRDQNQTSAFQRYVRNVKEMFEEPPEIRQVI